MAHSSNEKKSLFLAQDPALSAPLEIEGNILFRNIAVKNALVEFVIQGANGETLASLGKTFTASNGHFYFSTHIPLTFRGHDVGIRIYVYSTPSAHGKAFPIFFGNETFLFLPHQHIYNLGNIYLQLAWSFCEKPLFFIGRITKKHHDESALACKMIQVRTPGGYILAETPISIDGSYHLYTYADGRLPEQAKILLCVMDKGKIIAEREGVIRSLEYVYEADLEINDTSSFLSS